MNDVEAVCALEQLARPRDCWAVHQSARRDEERQSRFSACDMCFLSLCARVFWLHCIAAHYPLQLCALRRTREATGHGPIGTRVFHKTA